MIQPRLFLCSGAKLPQVPSGVGDRRIVCLDSIGPDANVNIVLENVARKLNQHLSPRLTDLLEIASYVFTADCATRRGEQWTDGKTTEPWGRDFSFVIPVRDCDFWTRPGVQGLLQEILKFLSNDAYSFTFLQLAEDRHVQEYFNFGDMEDWPFHGVERVLMFSGGLDSLAGVARTAKEGKKTVLVSHRPMPTLDARQKRLFHELEAIFPGQMIHVPVWVNKDGAFGREPTQRSRSFLYSALGAIVGESITAGGVRFFENGVVSINLPVADEALGARASRTTHPSSLSLFTRFFSLVTGREFEVDNPFIYHTKAEIVEEIITNGMGDLIRYTCSCAHPMFKSKRQWHCGTCSQCIDRRFAVLASGHEEYDPDTDYVSDVFVGPRKEGYEKNVAVDYVRHGVELERMSEGEIASTFNLQFSRATKNERNRGEAAAKLIHMHQRHGADVVRVLRDQLVRHSNTLLCSGLEPTSLLSMSVGGKHREPSWRLYSARIEGILTKGVPTICQKRKPDDEPEFQQICDGLLKGSDAKLVREFPFMRWSSTLTKPDWSHEPLRVWVEAKYIRKKRDIHQISEAISSDITKYGDSERRTLFVIYDPHHLVLDDRQFFEPIDARWNMRGILIR
jgi:Queuosine biosynthesis protein QueC